jgi:hypothetical protein
MAARPNTVLDFKLTREETPPGVSSSFIIACQMMNKAQQLMFCEDSELDGNYHPLSGICHPLIIPMILNIYGLILIERNGKRIFQDIMTDSKSKTGINN